MDLSQQIDGVLWEKVRNNFDNESYTNAILDAVNYMGEVIRTKSGLDMDGVRLVNKALKGNDPTIKVRKLKTESEKNIQMGLAEICSGIFSMIRNPRSHSNYEDTLKDAISAIVMIDYVLKEIKNSKSQFDIVSFIDDRVYDVHYVSDIEYSKLLVKEIPENKRLETFYELFGRNGKNFYGGIFFTEALILELSINDIDEAINYISEELRTSDDKGFITKVIGYIPRENFLKIDEITRRRMESIVIKSFELGEYDIQKGSVSNAEGLGSWYSKLEGIALYENRFVDIVIKKLNSENIHSRDYAIEYGLKLIPSILKKENKELIASIKRLKENDVKSISDLVLRWEFTNPDFYLEIMTK